jgi:hypothetical protein
MNPRPRRLRGAILSLTTLASLATGIVGNRAGGQAASTWKRDPTFARTAPSIVSTQIDFAMHPNGRSVLTSSNPLEAFTAAGSKDLPFEMNAAVALTPPSAAYGQPDEVEFQSTGKLIVANGDTVYRLNTIGALDTTFAASGKFTESPSVLPGFTGTDLSVDQQDRIIVGRRSITGVALTRYSANGVLDATFGTNGTVSIAATSLPSTPFEYFGPRLVRGFFADGSILVSYLSRFQILRITSGGVLDTTWGNGQGALRYGSVPSTIPDASTAAWNIPTRADGTFLLVFDGRVQKWLSSGVGQDLGFGYSGEVVFAYSGPSAPNLVDVSVTIIADWLVMSYTMASSGSPSVGNEFVWINSQGDLGPRTRTLDQSCSLLGATLTSVMCASPIDHGLPGAAAHLQRLTGPAPAPIGPNGYIYQVSALPLSATSIQIKWIADPTNEKGFLVYRVQGTTQTLVNGPSCPLNVPNLNSCTDTGLAPDSYYQYYVYAWNNYGVLTRGSYLLARTRSANPSAPNLTAAVATSATSVRIDWQDTSTDESGFKIYRYQNGGWLLETTVAANSESAIVTDPSMNTVNSFIFRVAAVNSSGESDDGTYTYTYQRGTPSTSGPEAPSYAATRVTGTTAQINWIDNASNELGYLVYRIDGPTSQTLVAGCAISDPTLTSCTDTGLTPGTTYQYVVYSWNMTGAGYPGTIEVVQTPKPFAAPVIASAEGSTGTITLAWLDQATDETGYEVIEWSAAMGYVTVATLPPNSSTYTEGGTVGGIGSLPANTTHVYVVRAQRSGDVSSSQPIWATTLP